MNLTENQTLYAGWKAKTFTVTFDAGGGTISTQSKTVTNGEPYGSLPAADKQGYAFIGWFTKPESEKDSSDNTQIYETTVVNLTDNQTLYAYWGRQYTVTFSDEGRTVTPSQMVVTNGDTYGSLPTPGERNGYEFLGWFTTFAGGVQIMPSTKVNLTDDQTLYAHWKAPDGTEILVHFAGNGSSVTPMSKYVIAGQEYGTLPVPDERYGYEFVGWYTSATSGKKVTETSQVANDAMEHTLYAHWKIRDGFVEVTLYANNGKFTDDSDKKTIVVPRNQPYGKLPGYPQDVFRAEDSSGQKYNFWVW